MQGARTRVRRESNGNRVTIRMSRPSIPSGGQREELPPGDIGAHMTTPAHVPLTHNLPPTVSRHPDPTKNYSAYAKSLTRPIAPAPVIPAPSSTSSNTVSSTPLPVIQTGLISSSTESSRIQAVPALPTAGHTPRMIHPVLSSNPQPSIVAITTAPISSVTPTLNVPHVPLSVGLPRVPHHTQTFPPHLPRGAVAASALSATKSAPAMTILRPSQPCALQIPTATTTQSATHPLIHTQIQNRASLIPQIRPGAPSIASSVAPSVGVVPNQPQSGEGHRLTIPLSTSAAPAASTSNIHITLQPPRATKPVITQPQHKAIHITQGMSTQSKIVMSPATVTPMLHSNITTLQKTAVKVSTMTSAVTPLTLASTLMSTLPSPAVTTVTVSALNTTTPISSSIPVAKVQPQRQQQMASVPLPPSASVSSQEHPRVDIHPHLTGLAGQQSQASTIFSIPQAHRASPNTTPLTTSISLPSTVAHSDVRSERLTLPYVPLQYPLYCEQHYSPLYQQVAPQPLRTGIPTLQAAHGLPSNAAQAVRFNSMMVPVQDPVRHPQTLPLHSQYSTATTSVDSKIVTAFDRKQLVKGPISSSIASESATVVSITSNSLQANLLSVNSTLASAASSLYPSMRPSTPPNVITPQQSTTPQSTSHANSNSMSPRPSILRKRTSDGTVVVKKPIGLSSERHSPRPEPKADSTPQSNTSSPKTPATPAGESQSSTDTALSSEATTPTQNSQTDVKVKQEPPDSHENGSLPNSVEASPRKKPRKQLLNATEELKDNLSTDDELEKLAALEEKLRDIKQELKDEYIDNEGIRWSLEKKRPPVTLLMNFYNISWKPRNNHFTRYTDVKDKEERRPTVNELSNQRGIMQKASGWKLYHMAAQMEDLVELEKKLCDSLTDMQSSVAPRPLSKHSITEDEMRNLHELSQGNIQRCRLITNQLEEARTSMLKVLDHKQRISDIINKHMSKRPIKKKERT
ncbi:hypothetical protein ScPMuIL_018014 [Solemya velum]